MNFKTTSEVRSLFIEYFKKNSHLHIPSSSLIPNNDATLLFTNAGMVQFKNVLTGLEKRDYTQAVTCQKCLRAGGKHNDLENVGFTARHHTFFEMLGNFSFGAYFKEKAIFLAWDFLTNQLQLKKEKLLVTVYHTDDEAYEIWKKITNLPDEKIIRISTKDNFWEMGDTGPCGPCSEIFYDHGEHIEGGIPGSDNEDGDRYIEIWNLVFVQYEKQINGELLPLANKCIDTGMGLERIAAIMQGVQDNYDIDLFQSIMKEIEQITKVNISSENKASFKVIADHIRASTFLIADGIIPSNEGRGYILRRIIRRAVRHFYLLGSKNSNLYKLVNILCELMGNVYKEIITRKSYIEDIIKSEEEKFSNTFENGLKILNEEISKIEDGGVLSGKIAFRLYETFGFPVDLTEDVIKNRNITIDHKEVEKAAEHHKNLAKNSWVGGSSKNDKVWFDIESKGISSSFIGYDTLHSESKVLALVKIENDTFIEVEKLIKGDCGYIIFDQTACYAEKGGQIGDIAIILSNDNYVANIDDTKYKANTLIIHKVSNITSEISVNTTYQIEVDKAHRRKTSTNHTATHILYEALVDVLGNNVSQQGSLVTDTYLRLDISHNKAISKDELLNIENIVNKAILADMLVSIESMPLSEALSKGALPLFMEKYPEIVRTVKIQDDISDETFSFMLCGGIHAKRTGEIGLFKIISESSIAGGVRRIEAITGMKVLELLRLKEQLLEEVRNNLSITDQSMIIDTITNLKNTNKELKNSLQHLKFDKYSSILEEQAINIEETIINVSLIDDPLFNTKDLQKLAQKSINKHQIVVTVLLLALKDDKVSILALQKGCVINLKELIVKYTNSSGGGNTKSYQGSAIIKKENITDILSNIRNEIQNKIIK